MNFLRLSQGKLFAFGICFCSLILPNLKSVALPPPDDLPEEVLATQIILEARSDIDNSALTVEEYAAEKIAQKQRAFAPEIDSSIRQRLYLIQLLKLLKTISPVNN